MIEVQIGDSRRLIHGLTDASIDCVMTSPPYWGLRDYKTESIIFDGLPDCEHVWGADISVDKSGGTNGGISTTQDESIHIHTKTNFCSLCGAWRGQLGLEPTPELFIKHLLDFFVDVKLKLKDEGNCFVNLGDSYSTKSGGMAQGSWGKLGCDEERGIIKQSSTNLPSKCLCMIPERFAWGMIERGWILRNEIIWAKPNHMPESVTDRLTKSHEEIYHFVKQGKYYYNLDAIREPHTEPTRKINSKIEKYNGKADDIGIYGNTNKSLLRYRKEGLPPGHPLGKNPGDVWNITTQPYPESHFAVFPLELVRRPILAGCPEQVCIKCGKARESIYETDRSGCEIQNWDAMENKPSEKESQNNFANRKVVHGIFAYSVGAKRVLKGYTDCGCNVGFKPGTVLDPFAGSGTVGEFCRHNDRNAILFELNPDYKKLIEDRAMLKTPALENWL